MKAGQVIEALRWRHSPPEWAFFEELRCSMPVGRYWRARTVDAWAMNCWRSRKYLRVAYEVKVSRSDFKKELKDSRKRDLALWASNELYLAVPWGLVEPSEVPEEMGLVYVQEVGQAVAGKTRVHVVKRAPRRATEPGWPLMAAVARRMFLQQNGGGRNILEYSDQARKERDDH